MKKKSAVAATVVVILVLTGGLAYWRLSVGKPGNATNGKRGESNDWLGEQLSRPRADSAPRGLDLILAALKAGKIDYETSLLYRAYALVADPRLPQDYRGQGPAREDLAFFHEVQANDAALSAELKRELHPFIVRPSDPQSYLNTPRPQARGGSWFDAVVAPVHAAESACDGEWVSEDSTRYPYKAWGCGPLAAYDIQRTIAALDSLWEPMTVFMGPPVPDTGDPKNEGDDRIDIYVVPGEARSQSGRNLTLSDPRLPGPAAGMAVPFIRFSQLSTSGYVVINGDETTAFKSTLAHEFFHLQQFAHNYQIAWRERQMVTPDAGRGATWWTFSTDWFVEGSATWAEWRFVPETAVDQVHNNRLPDFQRNIYPLAAADIDHVYSTYVWPFFMQQEKGDQAIARAWRALPAAGRDPNRALDIIEREVPFETNFRIFARRNLNSDFEGTKPVTPLYQDLHAAFPEMMPVWFKPAANLRSLAVRSEPYTFDVAIPGLKADYYGFHPHAEIQQLSFDFSLIGSSADLDVDLVVKDRQSSFWRLESLPAGQARVRFCKGFPEQDLNNVIIVFSNHNKAPGSLVAGRLIVEASTQPCPCGTVQVVDTRKWTQRSVISGPGVSGHGEELETASGGFLIAVDESGRVQSSGTTLLNINKSSQLTHQLGSESRKEVSTETTKVVGGGGHFEIGPTQPDGSYVIDACTAATERLSIDNVTSSEAGGSRADSRMLREDGICVRLEGKSKPGDLYKTGSQVERARLRGAPADTPRDAWTYTSPSGMATASGSASGAWTATWHVAPCSALAPLK